MAVGRSLDHPLGCSNLRLAHCRARLDIHDHRIVDVDQVIGGVAEIGAPAVRRGIARRWIDRRDALGLDRSCATKDCIIKNGEVLLDGTPPQIGGKALRSFDIGLPIGFGPDQAGIDSETVASDQSFIDAAPHGGLEQLAEQITLTKAAMAVL